MPFLRQYGEVVVYDLYQEKDLTGLAADMALVFGGDGSILRAARQMGYQQAPVLGVNLGKLGFLADLGPDELRQLWPRVAQGDYCVTYHLMFECVVQTPAESKTYLGLNDVSVQSGPPFHMIDLDLLVDEQLVATVSGDGLIISTPVGSTAHSLSAGGPIVGQELAAFAITPLNPHTLTIRPVVDSADKVYTIVPRRLSAGSTLIIDGQDCFSLTLQHRIIVRKAPVRFGLVKVPGHNYYRTLRDKLRWGTGPNFRMVEPFADG